MNSTTMEWPYRFVTLTPAQVEQRRQQLDQAGYFAYVTPVLLLLAVFLLRQVLSPASKGAAQSAKAKMVAPGILEVQKRRLAWWLNEPAVPEFGARKIMLLGLSYAGFLLFLIFKDTGNDYLHLTKAFGHVAASQLPWQYMLAIKSPMSPIQQATGLSWENLNNYHRLFGRIVHLLIATHSIMYLNFYVQAGLLTKRLGDWDVRTGIIAFMMFNIVGLMSVPPIRKSAYHAKFFKSHVIQSGLVTLVLMFHNPYIRKYVAQAFILYVFNGITRTRNTSGETLMTVSAVDATSVSTALIKLRIPAPLVGNKPVTWQPGQHVYVKQGIAPITPRNPFTIVSAPPSEHHDSGEPHIDLVLRNRGGPGTSWLEPKHHQIKGEDREEFIMIEGPYGEAREYMPPLLASTEDSGRVLLVAGGIGATYTISIYTSLLKKRKSTKNIHFVWFVKSLQDAQWGVPMLNEVDCDVDVRIYITKESDKAVLASGKAGLGELKNGIKILNYGKRPAMKDIVDRYFASAVTVAGAMLTTGTRGKDFTPVTVLSCGPPGMSNALRKEVSTHVMGYGRDVMWYEETFGHGAALEKDTQDETFRQKGLAKVIKSQSL